MPPFGLRRKMQSELMTEISGKINKAFLEKDEIMLDMHQSMLTFQKWYDLYIDQGTYK